MLENKNTSTPPGWIGGFRDSNPKFEYPKPNLTSLPLMCNMAHVNLLKRQLNVRWPEFSWVTNVDNTGPNPHPTGEPSRKQDPTRCYQMFSPFISRAGYTDTGRIYSIICPQQGVWLDGEICINVEVTVTGVRGWMNESDIKDERTLAADMTIQPRVWLSPKQGSALSILWPYMQTHLPNLPLSKENAILINSYEPNKPHHPYFYVRKGETPNFESPARSRHESVAYMVSYLEVEIGNIESTNDPDVDAFNSLLMDAFNLGAGNMLSPGNVLTWNVWFLPPALVNQQEWKDHGEKWRKSIDAHHGPPYSEPKDKYGELKSSPIKYFDNAKFVSEPTKIKIEVKKILDWLYDHIPV